MKIAIKIMQTFLSLLLGFFVFLLIHFEQYEELEAFANALIISVIGILIIFGFGKGDK